MKPPKSHTTVSYLKIDDEVSGQRIDNFLFKQFKGVPKSRVYRALRQGEVRVNKKRAKAEYRLQHGDELRLPPLRVSEDKLQTQAGSRLLTLIEKSIIYEDAGLVILNKPSGMASHGGSGINFGAIETLRQARPQAKLLELVHRLDRDTSGCLMIAKKRSILVALHELIRLQKVEKVYLALVKGKWQGGTRKVKLPLMKNQLQSGERMVQVNVEGKHAETLFEPIKKFADATLMKVVLGTGRTHQIRVHAAQIGYPIVGDEKYGDKAFNNKIRQLGLHRLFLHAASLTFYSPVLDKPFGICALIDKDLRQFLQKIN